MYFSFILEEALLNSMLFKYFCDLSQVLLVQLDLISDALFNIAINNPQVKESYTINSLIVFEFL